MPLPTPYGGRRPSHAHSTLARLLRRSCLLASLVPAAHATRATLPPNHPPSNTYDQAQRMREALEGRPAQQRTRRDYDRVLEAFRAVSRASPRSAHTDTGMVATAELLAEEGRLFQQRAISLSAIEEYELLRRQNPSSRYRASALLTEGEIYSRDLGDSSAARSIFSQFLKEYPQNALAPEARQELAAMRVASRPAHSSQDRSEKARAPAANSAQPSVSSASRSGRRNTVLQAALASGAPQPTSPSRLPPQTAHSTPQASSGVEPAQASAPSNQNKNSTLVEHDLSASSSSPAGPEQASNSAPATRTVPIRRLPPAAEPSSSQTASAIAAPPHGSAAPNEQLSETALTAPPPPARRGQLPLVTGVRHWSTAVYTRVAIDLGEEVKYEASRAPNPDRIFFDLHGARLSPELIGKAVVVTDGGYLKRIRAAQFSNDVVRVVLDVSDVSDYSAFFLPNPSRLIIDIHGRAPAPLLAQTDEHPLAASSPSTPARQTAPPAAAPANRPGSAAKGSNSARAASPPHPPTRLVPDAGQNEPDDSGIVGETRRTAAPTTQPQHKRPSNASDTLGDIATLDQQPNTVRATRKPTTAPVAASVADTTPAPQPGTVLAPAPDPSARSSRSALSKAARARAGTPADIPAPAIHAPEVRLSETRTAAPTATGERSMVRALGLKIGRIVVDAGHGGHDSGTLGPGGIEEKDVVLDVALRLGRLLKQRLGADVIYTRDDDTFIPLETRTAIANKSQADLFISVHANSSQDPSARGVETYYLNFTSSADALEVAARENAVSEQSIHQLSDLVKKITLQDKISESREFAGDVEQSLYAGLENGNPGLKDRGVKKAPFVVLIEANMPSILAEISFLTNPDDAHQLRDSEYKQRIAESLYRGVAKYIGSLSGVRLAESSSRPTGQ